ncbi:DMT family transporter [Polaromonas sp. YR568]|uniref:DMT family transporter n=1 Tax=Polaromonas sp. YR568 TaxID=1855301 RepID=UPI003137C93D
MSQALPGYLLSGGALLFFTTAILVTRLASNRIPLALGFVIATLTNVVFSGLAFAVQGVLSDQPVTWNTRSFWLFAVAGVFSTYLGRWFFYESVVRFGPAKASVFQVSSPLFTAAMALVLLGERLTLPVAMGMVLTVGGLILVSYKPGACGNGSVAPAEPAGLVVPVKADSATPPLTLHQRLLKSVLLLGLASSLAYAIGNVLRGSAVREWNEPILGGLIGAGFGLAMHLLFMPAKSALWISLRQADRRGVWLYALIGVCTISGQICTIGAMRFIPLSIATLVTLCTPLLVFPLSYFLLKSRDGVTRATVAGCGLTLVGIFIIVLR